MIDFDNITAPQIFRILPASGCQCMANYDITQHSPDRSPRQNNQDTAEITTTSELIDMQLDDFTSRTHNIHIYCNKKPETHCVGPKRIGIDCVRYIFI